VIPARHKIGAELLFCKSADSKVVRKCRVCSLTFGRHPKYDIVMAANPLEVISDVSPDQLLFPKIEEVQNADH